jgi:Icc-related predicted phosphoesterase
LKQEKVSFVNVLSVSDKKDPIIYGPQIKKKFNHIDFVISCGDLSYYYQEFIISSLDIPLFFVRGNHDPEIEYSECCQTSAPRGGIDLHRKIIRFDGVLLAGVEGSIRYKKSGRFQYTQSQMLMNVVKLIPGLIYNRLVYGRYLDIFVTHAPPRGIHDKEDLPHQGVKAFLWLINNFQPKYHFHGHTHLYRLDEVRKTQVGKTQVINTYAYLETKLELGD